MNASAPQVSLDLKVRSQMIYFLSQKGHFLRNLQIAVESSSDRVERADFTGMMVPFRSFSRYDLILRGFVSDIDQNSD